ncbi:alpha/beta fold hydrolase [Wohlfahrtiimonas larvae]|uniref:AB hydrolase-1 domain-containing protein n=1 Tax=Wohlfahrtiimonas larvae TaxID=1157986 RepID=A0ABP9MTS5_9GAMM|nr:alpha/beta hydrolase [Wohlfahrtiimonas larvae]
MKTIIFMHGILGDEGTWQPAFQYLPVDINAISYSMLGFGEHGKNIPEEQFNTNIHAHELIQFCQSLNQEKISVVAWSYSCHIVLLAALQAPQLFETIYLYDCIVPSYGLENDEALLKIFSKDLNKMMSPVIKAIRTQDNENIINAFVLACSEQNLALSDQSSNIQAIKKANAHTVARLLTQAEPAPVTPKMLEKLAVPCGIYWGENSRTIFQLTSQTLYKNLPESICLNNSGPIPNANHLLPETSPNQLIQHVLNHQ